MARPGCGPWLRRYPVRLMALGLCASWPRAAAAYRPFDSTDAAVAHRGQFELELGPGYLVEAGWRAIVGPRTVLNVGVAPRLEVVLEGIGLFPVGANGGA